MALIVDVLSSNIMTVRFMKVGLALGSLMCIRVFW